MTYKRDTEHILDIRETERAVAVICRRLACTQEIATQIVSQFLAAAIEAGVEPVGHVAAYRLNCVLDRLPEEANLKDFLNALRSFKA